MPRITPLILALICASLLVLSFLIEAVTVPPETTGKQALGWAASDGRLPEALAHFTLDEIVLYKQYHRQRLRHYLNEQILMLTFLLFSLGNGWFAIFSRPLEKIMHRYKTLGLGIFAFLYLGVFGLLMLPEDFYGSYLIEHQYQLSNQTSLAWFFDALKTAGLTAAIVVPVFLGGTWLRRRFPRHWYLPMGFSVWGLSLVLVFLSPLIIDPLFFKFTPLPQNELRRQLEDLCEKSGVPTSEIYVMNASRRTQKVNAYFTGLLGSRRIVLYDNLLTSHSPEEVLTVMAHEIGHWKHHHVAQGLLLMLPAWLAGFWICAGVLNTLERRSWLSPLPPTEWMALPVVLLTLLLLSYLFTPVANAISRRFETQADTFALAVNPDGQVFVRLQENLVRKNHADLLPHPAVSFYFGTHPTALERMARAQSLPASGQTP